MLIFPFKGIYGVRIYSNPVASPRSCVGEILYDPETTVLSSLPDLIEEQLGITTSIDKMKKNGFIPIHRGQYQFLVSNLCRTESDYFSIEQEKEG